MAASSKVGGFECEFIDPVSDEFFVCKICKHVARDPSLTSCCGETFCQACIAQILEAKKPCPDCEKVEFTTMPSAKIQKRILALQVRCAMKDRGCEWTGKLEGLDAHLDVDKNGCQYVAVPCPDCDQQIQKHELATHLADACPKRDYNCRYCGFSGTYEVVCNDHWPECEQYPIQCPNYCGLVAMERCTLEDHLKLCPTQEVECEFGCPDKFLQQDLEKHMEENTQKHLVLMSATTLRISQEFEKKFQEESKTLQEKLQEQQHEQREEFQESLRQKEQEIGELRQQLWEKDKEFHRQLQEKDQQTRDEIKGIHEQLRQKDQQIQEAEAKIAGLQTDLQQKQQQIDTITRHVVTIPFHFTVPNFNQLKMKDETWYSPPMYTHPCGYKFQIGVYTIRPFLLTQNLSVMFRTVEGEFDDQLPWPQDCTITLELINQHRDQDHITRTCTFQLQRTRGLLLGESIVKALRSSSHTYSFVATNLEWNAEKQTRYLKDNCLQFRVTRVELKK